jgi:hypothetical protein
MGDPIGYSLAGAYIRSEAAVKRGYLMRQAARSNSGKTLALMLLFFFRFAW